MLKTNSDVEDLVPGIGREALRRERHVGRSVKSDRKIYQTRRRSRSTAGYRPVRSDPPWQLVRKKLQCVYCLITFNTVTTGFRDFMQS